VSTAELIERAVADAPRSRARIAGFVYLLYFLSTVLTEVFLEQAGAGLRVPLADAVLVPVGVFATLAEMSVMLWLLVLGVDSQRWNEQASIAMKPTSP
jgi:hypothetical protein